MGTLTILRLNLPWKMEGRDEKLILQLIEAARKVRENAHAPYSQFQVGCALLGEDGKIYTGCNVENVAYGSATCAERTAVCKAVSEGCRKFTIGALTSVLEDFIYPCGNCLTTMAEFGDMELVVTKNSGNDRKLHKLSELIPHGSFATMKGQLKN